MHLQRLRSAMHCLRKCSLLILAIMHFLTLRNGLAYAQGDRPALLRLDYCSG